MYNINPPFVKNLAKNFMNKNYFCATTFRDTTLIPS